jgi:2'-5' RNA ligase
MRAFIAVDLEEEIKGNISRFIEKFDTDLRNVKWIKYQGMHITLKFLGEVSEAKIRKMGEIVGRITSEFQPFSLKIKGTGTFPHAKRNPRILWLGVESDQTLLFLQEKIETGLEKLGILKEKRKYHPHLTLGRVRTNFKLQSILDELERHREDIFGEMTVKKILLFQSILKPSGAEYKIISEFELG